jgi:hypothetical protein
MQFCPEPKKRKLKETWWNLPPELIVRFLAVPGLEKTEVTYYDPPPQTRGRRKFYTIVAKRTRKLRAADFN